MLVLGQRAATFALVCIGWVFFRSETMAIAFTMLGRLVTGWGIAPELTDALIVGTIAGMLALQFAPRRPALELQDRLATLKPAVLGLVLAGALFVIATLGPTGVAPFIYFQF
jgi:hypothetical protein